MRLASPGLVIGLACSCISCKVVKPSMRIQWMDFAWIFHGAEASNDARAYG